MEPVALQTKTVYRYWMKEYFDAFSLLSSRRQSGFSPQPIMLSEIWAYIDRRGVTDEEYFEYIIILLDDIFLQSENQPNTNKDFKGKSKGK